MKEREIKLRYKNITLDLIYKTYNSSKKYDYICSGDDKYIFQISNEKEKENDKGLSS